MVIVSHVYQYILTILDRNTRLPEVFPIRSLATDTIIEIFVNHWISRFGIPKRIITDQGQQFEAELFSDLTKQLGIQKIRTTTYLLG